MPKGEGDQAIDHVYHLAYSYQIRIYTIRSQQKHSIIQKAPRLSSSSHLYRQEKEYPSEQLFLQ